MVNDRCGVLEGSGSVCVLWLRVDVVCWYYCSGSVIVLWLRVGVLVPGVGVGRCVLVSGFSVGRCVGGFGVRVCVMVKGWVGALVSRAMYCLCLAMYTRWCQ